MKKAPYISQFRRYKNMHLALQNRLKKSCLPTRCLYWLFLSFLFPSAAIAQYSISGIVGSNKEGARLLEGAHILILESDKIDRSKEGGTYLLRGLGPGTYHLFFYKVGFKSILKEVQMLDTATVVHVEMKETFSEMEFPGVAGGITDLSSRLPLGLQDHSLLEENRKGNLNLSSNLSYIPGFELISNGPYSGNFFIRGIDSRRVLFNYYGSRYEFLKWNSSADPMVNILGTGRIQLVRGPSALIYGNASGGMIRFIEDEPLPAGFHEGEAALGYHTNTSGIQFQGGLKGTSESGLDYRARFGRQSHTSFVQGGGDEERKNTESVAYAPNSKFFSDELKAGAGMSKSWGRSELNISWLQKKYGTAGFIKDSLEGIDDYNEYQREREIDGPYSLQNSTVIALENTIISDSSRLRINLSYQINTLEEYAITESGAVPLVNDFILNTGTYEIAYESDPSRKIGFRAGSQGHVQQQKNKSLDNLLPEGSLTEISGFIAAHLFRNKWTFQVSGRIDSRYQKMDRYMPVQDSTDIRPETAKRTFEPLSFSAAVIRKAAENLNLRLNFSSAAYMPDLSQLFIYGYQNRSRIFIAGNDSLVPERSIQAEAGLDWKNEFISTGINIYAGEIRSHIHLVYAGGDRLVKINGADSLVPYFVYAQKHTEIAGAEFYLNMHLPQTPWLEMHAGFDFQNHVFKSGGTPPNLPAPHFNASIQFQSKKMNYLHNPYLKLMFRHFTERSDVADSELSTPSYSLFDVFIGGKIKWGFRYIDLNVSVNNVVDELYRHHFSLLRNSGLYEQGRNVSIRLRVPFGISKPV